MPIELTPEQQTAFDREATAIREARSAAHLAAASADLLRQHMDNLKAHLEDLLRCRYHGEIDLLITRLRRMRELYNAMEVGSFSGRCKTQLENAWQRLP